MSNDQDKVLTLKVRVSPELKQAIIESAHANNRSMNAEIVHHIQSGLGIKPPVLFPDIDKALSVVSGRKPPLIPIQNEADRERLAKLAVMAVMKALEEDEKKPPLE